MIGERRSDRRPRPAPIRLTDAEPAPAGRISIQRPVNARGHDRHVANPAADPTLEKIEELIRLQEQRGGSSLVAEGQPAQFDGADRGAQSHRRQAHPSSQTSQSAPKEAPDKPDANPSRRAGQPSDGREAAKAGQPKLVSASLAETLRLMKVSRDGELWAAVMDGRSALWATANFSFVINLLMLAGPLFMLQVYDRVMTSGSMPTLLALSVLTACVYVVIGALEWIRSRVVVRLGREFDERIADRVFRAALRRSVYNARTSTAAMRELDQIRSFVSGPGPLSLFDAPWTPVYLLIIFAFHPVLGVAATVGALVLLGITIIGERESRSALLAASKKSSETLEIAEVGQRNAEALAAMGMVEAYRQKWQRSNGEAQAWQGLAADRLGGMTATTKTLRLALQSMMLAVGAALALSGDISAGSIVAATIIFGRALAPVEQLLGQWRGMLRAAESFTKIDDLLRKEPEPQARTSLPAPRGVLEVQNLRVATPETRTLILANVSFGIKPGQILAVIGPSASGKSTLTRAITGLWPPAGGTIRLDGATLDQWGPDALGAHVGYLPQAVELFAGTVRENIARFRADATDAAIVQAAKHAHAHEKILALPNGYETELGAFGAHLSAGQRQRIALARALFGNPVLVVLDEPNANLDRAGDEALARALDGLRKRGCAIVLVSHRVQAIGQADLVLYLDQGLQRAFGPRNEVMSQLQAAAASAQPPRAKLKDEPEASE